MNCKEYKIKLNTKEAQIVIFQQKATDDSKHIANLGNIIEKLRNDIGNLENVVNNVKNTQQKVRDEYEETLMNQRKMFDDEIMELNLKHVKGTEKLKKIHSDEKVKLEALVSQLKENSDPSGGTDSDLTCCHKCLKYVAGSTCWSACSSIPSMPNTPSPLPLLRSSSQSTNRSSISSTSSVRTVLHSLHKIVNHKGEKEGDEGKKLVCPFELTKSILGNEDFDLSEDLDKSMEMFSGMLKAKDDEIETLNIKLLDMQKEFEFQVEKDKDFEVLEKLAEDEADTIGQLEKENCKLTEALNHVEKRINHDKEKWKSLEVSDKVKMHEIRG